MAVYFHGELREARNAALADGEGYQQILFVVERIGRQLWPDKNALGQFACGFEKLVAKHHPLEGQCLENCEMGFKQRYEWVRESRNDAMHIGAIARNLTSHCVKLSIMLEDALMAVADTKKIGDYMTHGPVCTFEWQTVALIRQTMLEHSYSHLPYIRGGKWHIVSDQDVCEFLWKGNPDGKKKKVRLKKTLCEAIETGEVTPRKATFATSEESVKAVLQRANGREPVLVLRAGHQDLLGIANAFDLM